tara:strand:- start:1544 stop:1957 length:414 start_codon:yes stop_codon:yes gene_type:complete
MKNVFMSFALAVLCTVSVNAQNVKGDWYIGTGDIANTAWTEWSIAPTVGYAIADNFMVGVNVSQADSSAEMVLDAHVRYFYNGMFGYVSAPNLDTDRLMIGAGKMFTFHRGVYVDPKVVYDTNLKTTNLMLGVGLKF